MQSNLAALAASAANADKVDYRDWQKRKASEFDALDDAAKKFMKQKAVVACNARKDECERENADCTGPALVGSDTGMYPFYQTRP